MNTHTLTSTVVSASSPAIAEEAAIRIRTVLDALYPEDNILITVSTDSYQEAVLQRYFARVQYKDNNLGDWDTVFKSAIIEAPFDFTIDQIFEILEVKGQVGVQLLALSRL